MRRAVLFILAVTFLVGCSNLPGMYRTDIYQGNYVEEEALAQVKVGMSKDEVRYLLGTPMVLDSFDPYRWYYITMHHRSNGEKIEHSNVTILFDQNNRVADIDQEHYL